ncbi:subtilisin-like protease SBT1.2 [Dendrobium catenatum]|uniref:Subtilisin-like protease SDD1 n=1 Tax=Dendrobium catenatum TaxID=906689 RepID=A0A2I0VUX5_9ASPA|nr:subtilisin-like protease SBT1.2 [Dendrobium catenatum]PKU67215.1 Subtilisin-like protease SDD1 [Dendrobium catenatum]
MDRGISLSIYCHSSLVFLLLISHLLPCAHLSPIAITNHHEIQLQTYIVHVQEPTSTTKLSIEHLQEWHKSFLPNASLDSGEPRIIFSYHHAISGFAAKLTRQELLFMSSKDGFILAHTDNPTFLFTTYTPDFLALKHWGALWPESSHGQGIIIAVIDTGIHPNHPSFDDKGMPEPPIKWRGRCDLPPPATCNNKLVAATAFKGRLKPSPVDNSGHGTVTASISAGSFVHGAEVLGKANGAASGTAPKAHLAIYKAYYNNHGTESDLLAAIDQAIADGVDILSMSIGQEPKPLYESSVAKASFSGIRKNIFPCCAAGNFGPVASILSNDAPWCLTVGAGTVDRRIRATVRLGNGMEMDGESSYQTETFDSKLMLPLVFPGETGKPEELHCQSGSLRSSIVSGKIVLCVTDEYDNLERSETVKTAGGAAMIVMNRLADGYTTNADPHSIPASHVSHADGQKIQAYIRTTLNPAATIIFQGTQFGARPTPAVASFSSRGPSFNNGGILKPDVVAPGVNILAAWPTEVGPKKQGKSGSSFNFASGTSMATPHVSGIAAMLKKLKPEWSPAAIKSAIMTTAYVRDRHGNAITDQNGGGNASFFAMGAGHVNPAKASDPGLVYDLQWQDYIPYLCGLGYTNDQVMAVTKDITDCSNIKKINAEELNYPSIAMNLRTGESKTIIRMVTNVGEASSKYKLQIEEPNGVSIHVNPETLQFSRLQQVESFTVKFSAKPGPSKKGEVSEGSLTWISGCYIVRSSISISFT